MGAAVAAVRESNAWPATKAAFEFLTLTATRSNEVRLADWAEIKVDSATWIIPETRMKNGLEHRVPLSGQAVDVLKAASALSGSAGLIFPSQRGKALTDGTLTKLLRENNIGCVPHGMRSSFSDWAAECTETLLAICKLALAHVNDDRTRKAYQRTDLLEKRRELMQQWADYIGLLCQE